MWMKHVFSVIAVSSIFVAASAGATALSTSPGGVPTPKPAPGCGDGTFACGGACCVTGQDTCCVDSDQRGYCAPKGTRCPG